MAKAVKSSKTPNQKTQQKSVEAFKHDSKRKNIPTAEYQSVMRQDEQSAIRKIYERRNRDLDPQLVWRGKDEQNWSDLVVHAPPLYIQEKIHPKVLIDDLRKRTEAQHKAENAWQADLFADFNGLPSEDARTEFYQHDANWTNRMILGDSLQVMASLAEREGLRGQVQCIYFDPPYGIKFNSNFQWSTTSRDVKDGNAEHITREPEQVKAFRDTWRDGIHSYLTYLRDRLSVARDLLTESGSIFVQIGDENVHRVRGLMDEVFGDRNFCSQISFVKTSGMSATLMSNVADFILWYAKDKLKAKYRQLFNAKVLGQEGTTQYTMVEMPSSQRVRRLTKDEKTDSSLIPKDGRVLSIGDVRSQGASLEQKAVVFQGREFALPHNSHWKTTIQGMSVLAKANRLITVGNTLMYKRFMEDYPVYPGNNIWLDTVITGYSDEKLYVVQSSTQLPERCILMATDPGDLVLDPTCGSGTTAYVAEQWGRRWITIDTSRVALALARSRIMGARYPYYLLADSKDGQLKEAEVTRTEVSTKPTYGNVRQGFVYERVPHITLKSIANNTEIDVIWEKYQKTLEPLREGLNKELGKTWEEWEIPREAVEAWSASAKKLHAEWWQQRIARQKEMDASIAAKAEFEYLYDKPYPDNKKVRVAGPFTVESISPHRALALDENDEIIDPLKTPNGGDEEDFVKMILENLKTAGVQQAHKEDKLNFTSLAPWPGRYICAEGRYLESETNAGKEKRAAIFIGPEFGTVSRADLVTATREAADAGFDVLVSCAFSYEAHATGLGNIGRVAILKARMNADLHMASDLKNTGKGNLFVIFGEPDIDISELENQQVQVKINGVDVFHPNTGEVRSDGADGIACWFIDTDYNEESFFVRHAYFLGANDPYKALKNTLKAEVNEEAWATLNSDTSRPFDKPVSGRIAVKVINHLGDEVMKVFRVK
jgi:adenine-specific DNA-methyltransferase